MWRWGISIGSQASSRNQTARRHSCRSQVKRDLGDPIIISRVNVKRKEAEIARAINRALLRRPNGWTEPTLLEIVLHTYLV